MTITDAHFSHIIYAFDIASGQGFAHHETEQLLKAVSLGEPVYITSDDDPEKVLVAMYNTQELAAYFEKCFPGLGITQMPHFAVYFR
jgi:hypothetical protein